MSFVDDVNASYHTHIHTESLQDAQGAINLIAILIFHQTALRQYLVVIVVESNDRFGKHAAFR